MNLSKEELETILKALKLLDKAGMDEKKCLKTVSAEVKDAYDSAFILGLSKNAFATSAKGTYSMTVGAGEYGFLCVPDSFAKISVWYIKGIGIDVIDEGTISFTNASGGVATYRIYRTTQSGLGSIDIEVK